jgi:hypothetical protein
MKTLTELTTQYKEDLASYRAKPNPEGFWKLRILAVRIRAAQKPLLLAGNTLQAYAAKARLIIDGKGRNGRSMSPALLEKHLAAR